jgi:hypothetical protein
MLTARGSDNVAGIEMIEPSVIRLALGEVEAKAADLKGSFSEKRARALEVALRRAVFTLHGHLDYLDKASKRQAQQISTESVVFLKELQEALRNKTPQNLAGVAHRATAWLALLRSDSGNRPANMRT